MISLEDLYRRFAKRLYNLLLRMLGDEDDALDALQQTFLRAHRALRGFREESKPYTWLYRIALNCAYTALKRRAGRRQKEILAEADGWCGDPPAAGADAAENAQKRETAQIVQEAIMELPADIRSAVLLRDIEQLPYQEVAKILNVPVGTAKSRVHRGRELLKERLERVLGKEFVAE
ncbi:MAG: hypothetical protein DRP63_02735 [Planctomycetota bacterium]|nr:MAG: hypothetical protein DRP63_02735 [Planctomycetota bacterium]